MSTPPDARQTPPRRAPGPLRPTPEQIGAYRVAFDHFNRMLFGGELPAVLLNFSRSESTADAINLNPEHLVDRSAQEAAALLVHEMCHVWRHRNGKPSRRSYHDRAWAEKMLSLGLTPRASDGKTTGVTMRTLVNDAGPFVDAYTTLPNADLLRWSAPVDDQRKRVDESKVKYTCGCSNAWGKPGLSMKCLRCGNTFVEEGA